MRLSDILGAEVIDADGRVIGRAHDVRLMQDGPMVSEVMASFRVTGIDSHAPLELKRFRTRTLE